MKNVLELLEKNAAVIPDKYAFTDENTSLTYKQLTENSKAVGSSLLALGFANRPVAVISEKSAMTVAAMLGVVYSGNFYTVIDSAMPEERIQKIFSSLKPEAILTDRKNHEKALSLGTDSVMVIEDVLNVSPDEEKLGSVRSRQTETDPLYVLYTSGSTGMPKGTVITHRNVLAYSEWVVNRFGIDCGTVFGNQAPFYFSMSVTDIYSTLRSGAETVIIPADCFTFPIKLIDFLNRYRVNTIYWVPAALSIAANSKVLDYEKPRYLQRILFAGEVMPVKQLNYWMDRMPRDTVFANLFGPTETTDICTCYVIGRKFNINESVPIGRHCDNCGVFILTEDGRKAQINEEGELYVRGPFLSPGYYGNQAKTDEVFVRNPLNAEYPETVYKTGDIVKENENGEIIYIGRRDYQIKHMGYRIEPGEIEAAALSVEGVTEAVCVYDEEKDRIVLVYSGTGVPENILMNGIAARLSSYMIPSVYIKADVLPRNANGKTDRKKIKENVLKGI